MFVIQVDFADTLRIIFPECCFLVIVAAGIGLVETLLSQVVAKLSISGNNDVLHLKIEVITAVACRLQL